MANPSRSDARKRIADLVGESVYQALGLVESLTEEFDALQTQETDALLRSVDSKNACIATLKELEAQRSLLCTTCGFRPGPSQMEEMTAWCDEDDVVRNSWNHLMEIAEKCNSLNLTNGAIVRTRQQHIESNLAILRGAGLQNDTYQRRGGNHRDMNQRSLAEA